MRLYIGIDLGTSAVKLLLMDEAGQVKNVVSREYPLEFPQPGWSQQNPEDWRKAVLEGIPDLLTGFDPKAVAGIGCGGQMHGLVVLDRDDQVIRPAILWNDGRTARQVDYLNNVIGKERLSAWTANIAFAGFTAPKILWMRENEPENFARIAKIMLPKDYVNYILTGVHACDDSDASGTLLLDVKNKRWSREMLDICGVRETQMPRLFESYQCIGTVKPDIARALGLGDNVKVAAGAGDNAAAAVGTGVVGDGGCNISLGTSAASCNKWLMEDIYKTNDYSAEQAPITEDRLGENHVFFLPYLMGERSPINDTNARGTFLGMTMDTTRADLTQAVLEGVAFAIRDSVEVARSLGIDIRSSKICGGGARSPLWKKMIANILNVELECLECEQGPGMGGAMLAMVACGAYETVQAACDAIVRVASRVTPEPELAARYEKRYRQFQKIYPACKQLFAEIANV